MNNMLKLNGNNCSYDTDGDNVIVLYTEHSTHELRNGSGIITNDTVFFNNKRYTKLTKENKKSNLDIISVYIKDELIEYIEFDETSESHESLESDNRYSNTIKRIDEYVFTAKIADECIPSLYKTQFERMIKYPSSRSINNLIDIEKLDNDLQVFDSIYKKEHIECFHSYLADSPVTTYSNGKDSLYCPFTIVTELRYQYIKQAGWAIITKQFLDKLSTFLKDNNFKALEIMAGKGVISKGLADRGCDIKAVDNFDWCDHINSGDGRWFNDVECITAEEAVYLYNDVDVIIASWMPMYYNYRKLIRNIRKHNPNVLILEIGESQGGGCTSDDTWFDRVEPAVEFTKLESELTNLLPSWYGIHDKVHLLKVKKPWIKK